MLKTLDLIEKYSYGVNWSQDDEVFIGSVAEFPGLLAHGKKMQDALTAIKEATEICIDSMRECEEPVPEPFSIRKYSGKFTLRMSNEVHRKLTLESAAAGVSLNNFIINKAIS